MAILSFEIVFVGTILYVAIFFLLYSTSLFLGVRGPLILALILYGFLGLVLFLSMYIFVLAYALLAWTERPGRPQQDGTLKSKSQDGRQGKGEV
jgi:hypothetical protein